LQGVSRVVEPTHFSSLEQWFHERPIWLQEAARLIIQEGGISRAQIPSLVACCKAEAKIEGFELLRVQKFGIPSHLFQPPASSQELRLNEIDTPKGVNALAPRKPLKFGDSQLTVVYGSNGSGKSGYVRLLKHACGSRNPGTLLSNVFSVEILVPECTFRCVIGQEPKEFAWKLSDGAIAEMTSMQIFDSTAATIYVDEENEVAVEPQVLGLFSRLARVSEHLSGLIQTEIDSNPSQKPRLPTDLEQTGAGRWYNSVSFITGDQEICAEAEWKATDAAALAELETILTDSNLPNRARDLRRLREGAIALKRLFTENIKSVSDESCARYAAAKLDATTKRQSATGYAGDVFASAALPGVGSGSWKQLWAQARAYSEEYAYRLEPYPNLAADARCVLCQQTLDDNAKDRMNRFEAFVKSTIEQEASKAEDNLSEMGKRILPNAVSDLTLHLDSAGISDDSERQQIQALHNAIAARAAALIVPQPTITLPFIPEFDVDKMLAERISAFDQAAISLEEKSKLENRASLERQRAELRARFWVSQQRSAIEVDVSRLKCVQKLEQAKKLTATQALSLKKSNLAEELITKAYVDRFRAELQSLGAKHIRVELVKTRTEKGHVYHRIRLFGCQKPASAADVLSEGEFRMVSLASFLADVESRGQKAPYVFDDPITSLDQTFEEATARRLVQVSKTRQVIIFTHRLSLVESLESEASRSGLTLSRCSLRATAMGIGDPDETFDIKNPIKALNNLSQRIPAARRAFAQSSADYQIPAKAICSDFRIIIEIMVEKALLSEVLTRFRRAVQTKNRIQNLAKINAADCTFIDGLMTKYSFHEHSQPSETPIELPSPDELDLDIKSAIAWVTEFTDRTV
jgi:energy-coupling factor transporter ATP-binding protein EcfA2